jgi:preprotein translocase subunit SecE
MISALLSLVLYIIVLGLIYWLLDYLIRTIPIPDPFGRVARIILVVVAVLIIIMLLLSLVGDGGPVRLPRL